MPWVPHNSESNQRLMVNDIIEEAQGIALDLYTMGGTNINDALIESVEMAKKVIENKEKFNDVKQTVIIFLTDGEPTTGETNSEQIRKNIKEANKESKVPIYGIAFGDGADFDLISEISAENHAFARRIYESGNSFEQLENFYNEISDPKLKNVTFEYIANGKVIPQDNLTLYKIDNVYGNTEYTVAGMNDEPIENLEIKLQGEDANGDFSEDILIAPCALPVTLREDDYDLNQDLTENTDIIPRFPDVPMNKIMCIPTPNIPAPKWQKTPSEAFMERLWAFLRIKQLNDDPDDCEESIDDTIEETNARLNDEEDNKIESACYDKAIELAKEYNFVTKHTSLVVESNDEYNGTVNIGPPNTVNPFARSSSFHKFKTSMRSGGRFGLARGRSRYDFK